MTYKQGSHDKKAGGAVSKIQHVVGAAADGDFGDDTAKHVAAWQKKHGLPATGIVNSATWARMFPKPKVTKVRTRIVVAAITNALRYLRYGRTAAVVRKQLVKVTLFGHSVSVHSKIKGHLMDWEARVREYEVAHKLFTWNAKEVQSFCWRLIRGSKTTRSMHSWAIAVDLDPATNPMGSHKHTIPDYVYACAREAGFACGVDWKTRPDPMHIEWRG